MKFDLNRALGGFDGSRDSILTQNQILTILPIDLFNSFLSFSSEISVILMVIRVPLVLLTDPSYIKNAKFIPHHLSKNSSNKTRHELHQRKKMESIFQTAPHCIWTTSNYLPFLIKIQRNFFYKILKHANFY